MQMFMWMKSFVNKMICLRKMIMIHGLFTLVSIAAVGAMGESWQGQPHNTFSVVIEGKTVPVRYYAFPAHKTREQGLSTEQGVIIFVHGIRSNARYFRPVAMALSKVGYSSFSLELPGYDQDTWGSHIELVRYDLPAYGQYVTRSVEMLISKEQIDPSRLTFWGHSMGSGIIYRALVENPDLFSQVRSIVFEAPAFANCVSKGSKFAIWWGKQLNRTRPSRWLSTQILFSFYRLQGHSGTSLNPKSVRTEGWADNYEVFFQNSQSMLQPENNIQEPVLNRIGIEKILWLWSPKDLAVKAAPPSFVPIEQCIQLAVDHDISFQAPDQVCQAVIERQPEFEKRGER